MVCPYSKSGEIVRTGRKLDTFEEYFAKHMNSQNPNAKDVCKIFKLEVL